MSVECRNVIQTKQFFKSRHARIIPRTHTFDLSYLLHLNDFSAQTQYRVRQHVARFQDVSIQSPTSQRQHKTARKWLVYSRLRWLPHNRATTLYETAFEDHLRWRGCCWAANRIQCRASTRKHRSPDIRKERRRWRNLAREPLSRMYMRYSISRLSIHVGSQPELVSLLFGFFRDLAVLQRHCYQIQSREIHQVQVYRQIGDLARRSRPIYCEHYWRRRKQVRGLLWHPHQ